MVGPKGAVNARPSVYSGTLPSSPVELPGHVAGRCMLASPAAGEKLCQSLLSLPTAEIGCWSRLDQTQWQPAIPVQWLHSSKPSKLNVSLTELLTPEMLNYSVKQTSRRLELLRG